MSKSKKKRLWLLIPAAVIALLAVLLAGKGGEEAPAEAGAETAAPGVSGEVTEAARTWEPRLLKDAIRVDDMGSYTGLYVEDGSDEPVSGLLMMTVTNITSDPIQFAQIEVDVGGETAKFTVSVLPAGATAVLIEQNRMAYDENADYAGAKMECLHLAGFDRAISLQEERFEVQVLNGAINITNISGEDITGTVLLCYKNVTNGVYHGGIAYRVRLENGLKAGEIQQVMGTHFHEGSSEILFVEVAG